MNPNQRLSVHRTSDIAGAGEAPIGIVVDRLLSPAVVVCVRVCPLGGVGWRGVALGGVALGSGVVIGRQARGLVCYIWLSAIIYWQHWLG